MAKKTKIILLLICLMLSLFICNAYAEMSFMSGSDLISRWRGYQAFERRNATHDDFLDTMFFMGYIEGVSDARESELITPPVTAGELCIIVGKYLDEHPEELHESGADLVVKAIRNAFQQKQ
jgi:hypothetical protein